MFTIKSKLALLGLRQFVPGPKRCLICGRLEKDNVKFGKYFFLDVAFKDMNFNNQDPSNLYWKCKTCPHLNMV